MEGQNFNATGVLTALSSQQIIECSSPGMSLIFWITYLKAIKNMQLKMAQNTNKKHMNCGGFLKQEAIHAMEGPYSGTQKSFSMQLTTEWWLHKTT